MVESIRVTFTAGELNRIEETMVQAQNHGGGSEFADFSAFLRRAVNTYVDFHERMLAGELDGMPSAQVLIRNLEGYDHLNGGRE